MPDLPPQPPSDDPTQVDVPAVPPAGTWTPITAPDPAAVPPAIEADPADAIGPAYVAAPAADAAPTGPATASSSWKAWVGAGVAAAVLALIAGFVIARTHDDSSSVSANGANGANGRNVGMREGGVGGANQLPQAGLRQVIGEQADDFKRQVGIIQFAPVGQLVGHAGDTMGD